MVHDKITFTLSLVNIIILLICLFCSFDVPFIYKSIVYVPLCYTFLFLLFRRKLGFTKPGIITINIISFFRYSITPMVILLTQEFNWIAKNYFYVDEAVIIMIVEMSAIFIAIVLYKPIAIKNGEGTFIRGNKLILLIALFVCSLLFIKNTSLTGNFSIVSDDIESEYAIEEESNGLLSVIWQSLCVLIYASVMLMIFELKKCGKSFGLYASLFCCLFYLLVIFTGQSAISRWYSIVTLIASACWIFKLYPEKKISIIVCAGVPAIIVLAIATILKNTIVGLDASLLEILKSVFNSTNMDTYFAGPISINNAISVKEKTGVGIESLFYDFLNNTPSLNHLIDKSKASVNIYNSFLFRGDQILPLVGQSSIWFGYLSAPVLSVLSVVITKKIDSKYLNSNSIMTYLYAFSAVWCALMPILNFTIWISWIYSRIIPAYILFHIAIIRYKCKVEL